MMVCHEQILTAKVRQLSPIRNQPQTNMHNKASSLFLAAALNLLFLASSAFAQGTAFTYQGRLNSGASAANGNYDFTFALFNNNSTNSTQIGSALTQLDVGVANGLFTVNLDFGPIFTGGSTWLAIWVR